jgi:hypothetical protein
MSTPDVQAAVDPLDEVALDAAVEQALAEIAKASDLDELKAVRTIHTGDRSALALANRAIGAPIVPSPRKPMFFMLVAYSLLLFFGLSFPEPILPASRRAVRARPTLRWT